MYINPITNYYSFVCNNKRVKKAVNIKQIGFNGNEFAKYEEYMNVYMNNRLYTGKAVGNHSPSGYIDVLKQLGVKIKNLMMLSGESAVFKMEDGNIIKISCDKYHQYIPKYHAPEIKRGEVVTSKEYPIKYFICNGPKTVNKFYYVIQKCGQMSVIQNDINNFIKQVEADGYKLYDVSWEQFAYFDINGKREVKLIDLGCLYRKDEQCEYD